MMEQVRKDNIPTVGHLVAVYGTLKKGFPNYERILSPLEKKAQARIPNMIMVSLGAIPACVRWRDRDCSGVTCEIYEVDDKVLDSMDQLEGVPKLYQREQVKLPFDLYGRRDAWMYVMQDELLTNPQHNTKFFPGGIWTTSAFERHWWDSWQHTSGKRYNVEDEGKTFHEIWGYGVHQHQPQRQLLTTQGRVVEGSNPLRSDAPWISTSKEPEKVRKNLIFGPKYRINA